MFDKPVPNQSPLAAGVPALQAKVIRRLCSMDLFEDGTEIVIEHLGQYYLLAKLDDGELHLVEIYGVRP